MVKLNQKQQEVGETANSFITALHALAEHCGYGVMHSEMTRDRLVVGLGDKRTVGAASDGCQINIRESCHLYLPG